MGAFKGGQRARRESEKNGEAERLKQSAGSNEAIRLRGTSSHLLFTQRTHTHTHPKLLPQLQRGPHFDYIGAPPSYFCLAQITAITAPSCGILTKSVGLVKTSRRSEIRFSSERLDVQSCLPQCPWRPTKHNIYPKDLFSSNSSPFKTLLYCLVPFIRPLCTLLRFACTLC